MKTTYFTQNNNDFQFSFAGFNVNDNFIVNIRRNIAHLFNKSRNIKTKSFECDSNRPPFVFLPNDLSPFCMRIFMEKYSVRILDTNVYYQYDAIEFCLNFPS